jgi:hypothetical protein
MALAISTITNSIAALSVSGLTIKDMDEIPSGITARDCPMLVPDMDSFVSGLEIISDTFGAASVHKWTAKYHLNYLLLYAQAGTGRVNIVEHYSGMVQKAFAFIDAVVAADPVTGSVDSLAGTIGSFAIVEYGGVSFHSCAVSIAIQEFIN